MNLTNSEEVLLLFLNILFKAKFATLEIYICTYYASKSKLFILKVGLEVLLGVLKFDTSSIVRIIIICNNYKQYFNTYYNTVYMSIFTSISTIE